LVEHYLAPTSSKALSGPSHQLSANPTQTSEETVKCVTPDAEAKDLQK
jgi:hypothetical protein